jgi:hypothetical protein
MTFTMVLAMSYLEFEAGMPLTAMRVTGGLAHAFNIPESRVQILRAVGPNLVEVSVVVKDAQGATSYRDLVSVFRRKQHTKELNVGADVMSYDVSAQFSPECSAHGVCMASTGECFCQEGYTGLRCLKIEEAVTAPAAQCRLHPALIFTLAMAVTLKMVL